MMRTKKITLALMVMIITTILITGCGKENITTKIADRVKGNLDALYLNEASDSYLEDVGVTKEQLDEEYLDGIKAEAAFFCYYIGAIEKSEYYETLPESTRAKVEDTYKEIYKLAKYQVRDPEQMEDESYSVEVTVQPIDVIDQAFNELNSQEYQPFLDLVSKYNTGEVSEQEFFAGYAEVMAQLVTDLLPEAGYNPQEAVIVNVTVDEEGNLTVNPDDLIAVDSKIISYSNLVYEDAAA